GLVNALYKSIEDQIGASSCIIQPRHAIRAVKDGKTVDVAICFECGVAEFWMNGKRNYENMTETPLPLFDRVLKSGKIPLAKRAF
ncbi:MAG TPA: hypothetical protein VF719_07630, partial [Abditibacteriaceae bacterium]